MTDPADPNRASSRALLDESTIADTWLEQFQRWFSAALDDPAVFEANAMQVATVDGFHQPSVRTVLAKTIDDRGVVFYTNYDSAKAADLTANPYAAAVFVWLAHERQVRLTGSVTKVSEDETAAYFATRPRGSQLGAWASPQSAVVASRAELDQLVADVEARFGDGPIPPPPFWGGYRIAPQTVEFWQGRTDRLHDRFRFRVEEGAWVRERLAP